MNDLVKRCADIIELENFPITDIPCEGEARAVIKAVIEDMREWAKSKERDDGKGVAVARFITNSIDAYAKDRGIE